MQALITETIVIFSVLAIGVFIIRLLGIWARL